MNTLNEKERELLQKLKNASKQENHFTLTLKFNDIELEERVFSADKFKLKTLSETQLHFLMNDLVRQILKTYSEQEDKAQNEIKQEQMNKMWKDIENKKTND